MTTELIELPTSDLIWDFESTPAYSVRGKGWPTSIRVDPFPCARHDIRVVREEVARVVSVFPTGADLKVVTLAHEFLSRTNGFTVNTSEDEHRESLIALSGKRTIVHHAMTRYLVAHEYGHAVDNWIDWKLSKGKDEFETEYADERGVACKKDYGGGRWNDNIGEVIADDFRILVAKTDVDFWPHSVPHPHQTAMGAYWDFLQREYAK